MKDTLCWTCVNACGGCSWSNHWEHSPVPGWKATRTRIRNTNTDDDGSYLVEECPEYVPQTPRKKPETGKSRWAEIALNVKK